MIIRKNSTLIGLTLALSVAAAPHARAAFIWSQTGSSCVVATPNVASINANFGTVTFAPGKSGLLKLSCPVTTLNTYTLNHGTTINLAPSITFYNDNGIVGGVTHCSVGMDFERGDFYLERGADMSDAGTTVPTVGHQVITGPSVAVDNPTAIRSYFQVYVQMFRDSPVAACNPIFVGAFLNGTP